jgi:hypothetical protein
LSQQAISAGSSSPMRKAGRRCGLGSGSPKNPEIAKTRGLRPKNLFL